MSLVLSLTVTKILIIKTKTYNYNVSSPFEIGSPVYNSYALYNRPRHKDIVLKDVFICLRCW